MRRSIVPATLLAVVTLVGACSAAATQAPTQAPASVAPASAAPASAAPASAAAASAAPASAAPASVAPIAVPSDQIDLPGKLQICSDIPYPPQEYFDNNGNPIGSDIEIGQEIARRLGLTPVIVNSVFDTIIEAVNGGKCDIIISAQNITADRVKQVDMIPFFNAGQEFVVTNGNSEGITKLLDLCGKKIAAESGTTEADYVTKDLTQACKRASKAEPALKTYQKDSDALLALSSGQVDSYFADSPVAGFYVKQQAGQFQLTGIIVGTALEGVSIPKNKTGLRDAVQQALVAMINDGTYLNILKKYGDDSGAVSADVAKQLNKTS